MPRRVLILMMFLLPSISAAINVGAMGVPTSWVGDPTLISGTSRYDAGEWIYTDFVYDDYGADSTPAGQANVVSLASTAGDFRYPSGPSFAGNAADIVEVRTQLSADGSDVEVRVLLQTLIDPAEVAIRVEANGVTSIATVQNAIIDAIANTVEFAIPGGGLGNTLSLNIGAGLHDKNGGLRAGVPGSGRVTTNEITTGGPSNNRLFDVAFNTHQLEGRGGAWNEDVQSRLLQSGDLAPFTQSIDLNLLRANATTTLPAQSGYFVRLFESRQNLGEGMGSAFPQYLGKWQPYAVWVPNGYDPAKATPLFLSLHSLSVHHNQYRGGPSPSASYKTFYEQFDAGIGAVVVTPLGRGPDGWYEDQGLVDVLEVWSDALKRYNINRERVFVGGYSMGGYGTYRLSTLMPDSFASAVSIVGPPANGIWAWPAPPTGGEGNPDNTRPQLENTRHVPFWITHGVADELVPVTGVVNQAGRLAELGHEYRLAVHPAEDHFGFVFKDNWSREAAWFAAHATRVKDPERVTFKLRKASWATASSPHASTILSQVDALAQEVGARLDAAYWVDDIVASGASDITGVVDLTSEGISRRQVGQFPITTIGTNGPSPHTLTGQYRVWAQLPVIDVLRGRLSKVSSLTIDVGRAGLSNSPSISISSDMPATITFVRDGVVVGQTQVG